MLLRNISIKEGDLGDKLSGKHEYFAKLLASNERKL